MRALSARDLLAAPHILFAACTHNLPNPLVYINTEKHTRRDELHDILPLYGAGPRHTHSVVLGRYPQPVYLDSRQRFLAACGDMLIQEQVPHHIHDRPRDVDAAILMLEQGKPYANTVDTPVLLVGRFGYEVWGHWLHEMLPKIVAAEAAFPGRFSYAVPADATVPTAERSYCTAVLESLAAYGITPDRLLRLPPGHIFKLNDAYDIAGTWQYGLHHDVVRLMRAIVADVSPDDDRRLMAMRHPADMRAVHNGADIVRVLTDAGFDAIDARHTNFLDQARLFARSRYVAGELGSNLSGLIFAPDGVKLLSFAPAGWIDAYFLYVMKERRGYQADVRGSTTHLRGPDPQRSSFMIDPADAQAGLAALNGIGAVDGIAFQAGPFQAGPFQAGGQEHPRAVGAETLHLRFGAGENGLAHLRGDWHAPEARHVWCAQDVAIIELPPRALIPCDYWLEIRGISVSHRDFMPVRRFAVTVNGVALVRTWVTGNARVFMALPQAALSARKKVTIEIQLDVIGPASCLGAIGDDRRLGIGLSDLVVYDKVEA